MNASSPRTRRVALTLAFGILAVVLLFGGACNTAELHAGASQPAQASQARQPRVCGRMLYMRNCMSCHGPTGLGNGPGAAVLDPKPRDFSAGTFRLVSTDNGVPTDEDLFDVITHGIVGSAMPPHDHLSERERNALVGHVRSLTRSRRADVLQADAEERGTPLARADALADATVTPGHVIDLPVLDPMSDPTALLAEGRRQFGDLGLGQELGLLVGADHVSV